ncbi:MAG TPA: TolC family protein [Thermoanaerobaculia bacterium]|nr:TolC family protein [Thermoanaerobaculia bacterium]
MKRIIFVLLCVAPPISATTQLTFDGALRRALEVNNQIEQSRQEIEAAEANRSFLLSAVMPKISATGNLQRNSIQRTFGTGSDQVEILPRNNWDYRLTLSQPIFAGRRELRAYSQAKLGVVNAREATRGTEDGTLLRVASSFLALVNAGARIDVEKKNIELAERRRAQAEAFYKAGEVTKVDILRAETAVKAAQRVLASVQQAREMAQSDLRAALDLNDAIDAVAPDHRLPPIPDEETLIRRAQESRPDVNVAENNKRIAALEVSKQRGFWLPTVTFDGGLLNQKSPFPAANYKYGAVRFTIPVFQSGEVQARVANAKAKEEEAKLNLENSKVTAREDVRQALSALHAAETSLGLAREQLTAAEAEYAQSFELYRAQETTSLDLASSEASLADARRAVAEENLNRDLAELRVWYAAGDIKNAVGVTNQ